MARCLQEGTRTLMKIKTGIVGSALVSALLIGTVVTVGNSTSKEDKGNRFTVTWSPGDRDIVIRYDIDGVFDKKTIRRSPFILPIPKGTKHASVSAFQDSNGTLSCVLTGGLPNTRHDYGSILCYYPPVFQGP